MSGTARKPRLVIVDMAVTADSPAGSCVLAEVDGLAGHFDITVFSERLQASLASRVEFVRVRAPWRPVLLRYGIFHLSMPWHYARWRLRGRRADCVQATQGQLPAGDIAYAHFCHRAYLRGALQDNPGAGLRRWARWATHAFNAWYEAAAFAKARVIVVPSRGLRDEIAATYPRCAAKLRLIANPIATGHFARPDTFDRAAHRRELGFGPAAIVLVFMALGDFERKGLGLLLAALGNASPAVRDSLRVLVVGGYPGEIDQFAAQAAACKVGGLIRFVGFQRDVRPYLWAGDAFASPSAYETFGLAVLQALAAGLPAMVATGMYGAGDFVADGHNGWHVARDVSAIGAWLVRVAGEPGAHATLERMRAAAIASAAPFGTAAFCARWAETITGLLPPPSPTRP